METTATKEEREKNAVWLYIELDTLVRMLAFNLLLQNRHFLWIEITKCIFALRLAKNTYTHLPYAKIVHTHIHLYRKRMATRREADLSILHE